ASSQYSSGHPGPSSYDTLTPLDYYGHGTHCAGIATADGTYGNGVADTMGIAPSAKIMSCPVDVYLHTPYPDTSMENNTMAGMQFCVSPTRDPTNGADVITMSLGLITSWLPRYAVWRLAEENILAAGIAHCVAAGNEGSAGIRTPGNCPPPWPNPANHPTSRASSAVITVGATDNNDVIASFSSLGPTTIWGTIPPWNDYPYPPGLTDPDVCMPGVDIYSTYYNGNRAYTRMSGTSMATPGAAGVVALMLSKNPNLTPRQIDSILECHAVRDLGPTGKDSIYGAGRINCSLAVAFTPMPSGVRLYRRTIDDALGNNDGIINPGEAINLPTWIINLDGYEHAGVTGSIAKRTPDDTMFTITDSVKSFGNLAPNDSAFTGSDGYRFTVSANATNGTALGMTLLLRDANDSTWVEGFDCVVGAPVLVYGSVVVKDSATGNGNGRLDPGEEAELIVNVRNNGLGNAYAISGRLASGNTSWLVVNDPTGTYGDIPHGAVVGNSADRYRVTASAAIPPGTLVPCSLALAGTGYATVFTFNLTVGIPPQPPGTIIWGPHQVGGMPPSWGLYGLGYDYDHDVLYVTYHGNGTIYKYSSDEALTPLGTIPTPNGDTGCHDIKYCHYDNTLWVHDGQAMRVYKIALDGTVLRSFPTLANDYPTGLAWDEAARKLYLVDRRSPGLVPGYVYVCDTLGNQIARWDHPYSTGYLGPRGAAIDNTNTNPYGRTVLNMFSWFDASQILDSCIVCELDTLGTAVYGSFTLQDVSWNARGVEYDPRDGSLWIGIMQDTPDNQIMKVYGFHIAGTPVAEGPLAQPVSDVLWVRAWPNPFRVATRLSYNLPAQENLKLAVYDASGRVVRTLACGLTPAGEHHISWNGRDNANQPIFIGDGGSRTITVGQLGANTNVLVNASLIDLASDAGGSFTSTTNSGSDKNLVFSAANSGAGGAWMTIDAKSGVEINSTAGPLNIGNDPVSQPISIGTGAAARTITIGNATSTTGLTLQSGTGAIKASSTVAGAHASGAAAWTLEATGTNGGDVGFFVGAGSPNGVVTGAKGDVFFDVNSPAIYICTATGTTWVALSSATGTTLQVAYENGNTITTSSAEGALAITTGSGAPIQFTLTGDDFTVNGANDVDFGGTTALSTFNLDTTGAITVDSSSSGVSIGAVDTSDFTVAANSAGNKTLNLVATNSGTGTAGVIIGTTGFATDYVSAYAGQIGLTAYRGEGYSSVQISSASDDDEAAVEISAEGATEGRVHISASSWLSGYVHSGLLAFGHYYANNTGAVIGAGRLVCTDTNSTLQVKYAQATAGGGGSNLTSRITGVTLESISNGASGRVTTVHGSVVDVVFSVAVAASDQGKVAYLGTNGQAVLDISGYGSGDYVVEVGIVQGPNSGAGTAAKVLFAPRFVAAIP
ncbi:MAG: S8 family serine peptidase, partial [candidate division WOR-3 bacterium]